MIQFNQISKRYANGQPALSDINLKLDAGEMAFVTGHSGAGKSTLLKLVMRLERPSTGHVILDGVNLARLKYRQIPFLRRNIGIIFQDPALLTQQTLFDNVKLPLVLSGYFRRQDIEKRVRAALDKVGLLAKIKYFPEELSGGEQQRVGIARAIVNTPPLLLADEPTGNLDPELSSDIMQLFARFNQLGTSVIIATHDINIVKQLNFRCIHLQQGKIIDDNIAP